MTRKEFILGLSAFPFVGTLFQHKENVIEPDETIEKRKELVCECGQSLEGLDRFYLEQSLLYFVVCPKCKRIPLFSGRDIIDEITRFME